MTALSGILFPYAAQAHESPIPHEHPHLHAIDGALMGYDALALVALGCAAATGLTLFLVRKRK